ncbi:hypothetical protein SAMN05518861_1239 [Mesorhizobium sp. YR577]|nr:hypothetical protein SAMN05518861_1239 [Mesorhizobium sp. YR577]
MHRDNPLIFKQHSRSDHRHYCAPRADRSQPTQGRRRNELAENRSPRSCSDKSPRTPAASAARLTNRATSWSLRRSSPTALPLPVTRRNSGPEAIRANLSQVSSANTGQDWSEEPRPISTSREPVLPRNVTRTLLSRTSIQPRPSFVWSWPTSSPTSSERRRPPANPTKSIARSLKPRKVP